MSAFAVPFEKPLSEDDVKIRKEERRLVEEHGCFNCKLAKMDYFVLPCKEQHRLCYNCLPDLQTELLKQASRQLLASKNLASASGTESIINMTVTCCAKCETPATENLIETLRLPTMNKQSEEFVLHCQAKHQRKNQAAKSRKNIPKTEQRWQADECICCKKDLSVLSLIDKRQHVLTCIRGWKWPCSDCKQKVVSLFDKSGKAIDKPMYAHIKECQGKILCSDTNCCQRKILVCHLHRHRLNPFFDDIFTRLEDALHTEENVAKRFQHLLRAVERMLWNTSYDMVVKLYEQVFVAMKLRMPAWSLSDQNFNIQIQQTQQQIQSQQQQQTQQQQQQQQQQFPSQQPQLLQQQLQHFPQQEAPVASSVSASVSASSPCSSVLSSAPMSTAVESVPQISTTSSLAPSRPSTNSSRGSRERSKASSSRQYRSRSKSRSKARSKSRSKHRSHSRHPSRSSSRYASRRSKKSQSNERQGKARLRSRSRSRSRSPRRRVSRLPRFMGTARVRDLERQVERGSVRDHLKKHGDPGRPERNRAETRPSIKDVRVFPSNRQAFALEQTSTHQATRHSPADSRKSIKLPWSPSLSSQLLFGAAGAADAAGGATAWRELAPPMDYGNFRRESHRRNGNYPHPHLTLTLTLVPSSSSSSATSSAAASAFYEI